VSHAIHPLGFKVYSHGWSYRVKLTPGLYALAVFTSAIRDRPRITFSAERTMNDTRVRGTVRWFDGSKGFVHPVEEGSEYLCITRPSATRAFGTCRPVSKSSLRSKTVCAAPRPLTSSAYKSFKPPRGLALSGVCNQLPSTRSTWQNDYASSHSAATVKSQNMLALSMAAISSSLTPGSCSRKRYVGD